MRSLNKQTRVIIGVLLKENKTMKANAKGEGRGVMNYLSEKYITAW